MSFFSSFYTTSAQSSDAISVLNKNQFAEAIQGKKVVLVDVRTPEEYSEGFIEGAINIDYFNQQSFIKQYYTGQLTTFNCVPVVDIGHRTFLYSKNKTHNITMDSMHDHHIS